VGSSLPKPIEMIVEASRENDMASFLAAWAPDALLCDSHRQYWGIEAIRRWTSIEWTGDNVAFTEIRDVRTHGDDVLMYAVIDGIYDKEGLPNDYLSTFFFKVRDDRVARLIILPSRGRRLGKMTQTRMASTCFSAPMPSMPVGLPGQRWGSPSEGAIACAKPVASPESLPSVAAKLLEAFRGTDAAALANLFADSGQVNDKHRMIVGRPAIQRWAEAEFLGPRVSIEALGAVEHYGDCIVTVTLGGGLDRSSYDSFVTNSSMATWRGSQPDAQHMLYVTPVGSSLQQLIITPVDGASAMSTDPTPVYVPAVGEVSAS
jgi:hypothetical protein